MPNPEHLAKLREGVEAWGQWRKQNTEVKPFLTLANLVEADLRKANLSGADLREANLNSADLREANLSGADLRMAQFFKADLREANLRGAALRKTILRMADLSRADLSGADLVEAHLFKADLREANLSGAELSQTNLGQANLMQADLSGARLFEADVSGANLRHANLSRASLFRADLSGANLSQANLTRANLSGADLFEANLSGANLSGADLKEANLVRTNLEEANLTACSVYGISAWNLKLEGAIQSNLVITPEEESAIQVDNLEVAQFIYLLLNNKKIRDVIDTITSKVVLILGRFTPDRKAVLDAIREKLRERDYLPVLFDFEKPGSKDLTGTISTLANLARFIVADLTDSSSVPHELAMVVPATVVPVQPILLEGQREYAMFVDLKKRYHWVMEPYQYKSMELLIAHLSDLVIAPAEAKAKELARKQK